MKYLYYEEKSIQYELFNEYDRFRGMIAQNDRKGVSVEHLKDKKRVRKIRC